MSTTQLTQALLQIAEYQTSGNGLEDLFQLRSIAATALAAHRVGQLKAAQAEADGEHAQALPALLHKRWREVATTPPPFDEQMRLLVCTMDSDFAGEQLFDIPAIDFYYQPEGEEVPGTEVAREATHWMPREEAFPGMALGSQTVVQEGGQQ